MRRIRLVAFLAVGMTGCTLYLQPKPTPYTSDQLDAVEAAHKGSKNKLLDCYNAMSTARDSAETRSFWRSATTFFGGAIGIVGGAVAVFVNPSVSGMPPTANSTTKNVGAAFAAGGALVTLIAQLVGDPTDPAKRFENGTLDWQLAADAAGSNAWSPMETALNNCTNGIAPPATITDTKTKALFLSR